MKNSIAKLIHLILFVPILGAAAEQTLDFWDEQIRSFGVAPNGRHVDASLAQRQHPAYRPKGIALDPADKVEGDFSIAYTPAAAGIPERFGFVAGLWGERWDLSPKMSLRFWLKVVGDQASESWKFILVDAEGNEAIGKLEGIENRWQEQRIPLSSLSTPGSFNWDRVRLFQFEAVHRKNVRIHFDGVQFESDRGVIGVTGKTLAQRMAEARQSREQRVKLAMEAAAGNNRGNLFSVVSAFAKMWLNEDLDDANQLLVDELKKSTHSNTWSLLHTPLYCRFYYLFSNRAGKYPGRMTPETEKLLLETLWQRTAVKNDIHWARQSTWYLDGSENHDLNAKASNLVTSRIFMNEPDFKDRIYPNYGYGGAYHYGRAGYYGPGIHTENRHGGGRANLSDGKSYTAADHYEAWLAFLKKYFVERAKHGFFVEYASHGYSKHTLNFVDLAYQYGGDDDLHGLLDDFLTLFWADWAQVSIAGMRGGPKTRHHRTPYVRGLGTADLISFHLGGVGNAGPWWYWNLINDYELPPVVWKMALDREGMGVFTYKSRGIGEEIDEWPRPAGTERSLVINPDSRFLKYTFVTPDFTLGTQMDHPGAIHSHLSVTGRWSGMTFSASPLARVVPIALAEDFAETGNYDMELMWQGVQHGRTLIIQQSRRWFSMNPEWFPANSQGDRSLGIWFGNEWDRRVEKDGWIFVQSGNGYAAVRPVLWDETYERAEFERTRTVGNQMNFNLPYSKPTVKLRTDSYAWSEDKSILQVAGNFTPIIIEAGRKADYHNLDAFMDNVLDNPLALYKTVVPGSHVLVYTGSGDDAKEIVINNSAPEIPTVGGKPIDYSYPMTFDSPFLKSKYKSGEVHIQYGNEVLNLNFDTY
jgi:hypothetical protein